MKKQISLKIKLLTLVFGSVLAFGGMAIVSYRSLDKLAESVSFLGHKRIPLTETLGNVRVATNGVPRFMWLSLNYPAKSEERREAQKKGIEFETLWDNSFSELSSAEITAEAKKELEQAQKLYVDLKPVFAKAHTYLQEGKDAEARSSLVTQMPPLALQILKHIQAFSKIVSEKNDSFVNAATAEAKQAEQVLLTVALGAGFTLVFFGFLFATTLTKQLSTITESVGQASTQVSAASEQLSAAAEELSSASQEQAAATAEASASLTEISGMVESCLSGAEKANQNAREVHSITTETKESMNELAQAMIAISESNAKIEQLVKVIEEIGEKTEVIDEIVFKTQLLSFNASVEAERAGEHGRGFAVVAQEVGNLAQMSGKAATEISTIVKQSMKDASSIASENKAKVERGTSLASNTAAKMSQVAHSLDTIVSNLESIVKAGQEQSLGVNQVNQAMDALSQSTQNVASTAEESASASEELTGQSHSLSQLVSELELLVTGKTQDRSHQEEKIQVTKNSKLAKVLTFPKKEKHVPAKNFKKAAGAELAASDEWSKL